MNFAFSEEQEELRRTVRQFLESKSPETEVRRLMETTEGYDPAVWKQMEARGMRIEGIAGDVTSEPDMQRAFAAAGAGAGRRALRGARRSRARSRQGRPPWIARNL